MKLLEFDYQLPNELIARYPAKQREGSRLLVVHRDTRIWEDRMFTNLPDYLNPGDLLVMNNTKVIPARLLGTRVTTGAKIELFLLSELARSSDSVALWEVLARPAKKAKLGEDIRFSNELVATVLSEGEEGKLQVRFNTAGRPFEAVLGETGHTPLPPYIDRRDEPLDRERYQTVYAATPGAVAAPTAGLHFSNEMLDALERKGAGHVYVLLHTGIGTFKPVEVENIEEHKMHSEYFEIEPSVANEINRIKAREGRIIAVGTTTVRTLESNADEDGIVRAGRGHSDIFLYPPYKFKVPDAMLTNFHMPKSTLLMMISAFAGREFILECYQHAVQEKYRFFSYGDAMLIL
jgi:S-adenosylmethionine:tRNA ribosyltransferase-isomerase